ncbi:MAG TPA: hypothetical protein DDW52_06225 [Planctomycetaceae bacterium]|nr:hypothetical protein [Planctomycetaceae bacterium]
MSAPRPYLTPTRLLAVCVSVFLAATAAQATEESDQLAGSFPGWEGIRVIEQDGNPDIIRAFDIDKDDRQEILVINPRYSRIDVYDHLPLDEWSKSQEPDSGDAGRNELPPVMNIQRTEIQLEQLPQDAILIGADDTTELAVVVTLPNRILFYQQNDKGEWEQDRRVDLLEGDVISAPRVIDVIDTDSSQSLLVGFKEGYQVLPLEKDAKASWLKPREDRNLAEWWLEDLDGDGNADIVEQRRSSANAMYWLRGATGGAFEPARPLRTRPVTDVRVLSGYERAPVMLLDAAAEGIIRQYELQQDDKRPLGKLRPLPIQNADSAAWCTMELDDQRSLVTLSPDSPQLLTFHLDESGWQAAGSYPCVSGVEGLACPSAAPKTLLLRVKDSETLYKSQWGEGRLSYPTAWQETDAEIKDGSKIVALQQVADTTWWARSSGSDVILYTWPAGAVQPESTYFKSAGSAVEEVQWLGGKRMLVKDRRSRGLKIVTAEGENKKALASTPSSLQRADIDEYRLFMIDSQPVVGRFVDGVMQWLDENLQPIDQVMLGDGRSLVDFAPESLTSGWALEAGVPYIHRIEPDDSGVAYASERIKTVSGTRLHSDRLLGLLIVNRNRLTQAEPGQPDDLEQTAALDRRSVRQAGSRKANCHRFLVADFNLDGREDLLLCDDDKHKLSTTVLSGSTIEVDATWPVFEDMSYPYSDYEENLIQEPRSACGLDMDGDGHPELALLCHDRLIIYLGRETE